MSDDQCLFCQIVSGEKPCYKIYEDANFLAFLDIYPFGDGHTQIIPKKHVTHVWDLDKPGELFTLAAKLVKHYRQVLNVDNCFSFVIEEWVPHAHLQILPTTTENRQRLGQAIHLIRQPQLNPEKAQALQTKLQLSQSLTTI
jgi:histidine triad (HIT) family protein